MTKNILFRYIENIGENNFQKVNTGIISGILTSEIRDDFTNHIIESIFSGTKKFADYEELLTEIEKSDLYSKYSFMYKEKIRSCFSDKKYHSLIKQIRNYHKNFENTILYSEILNARFRLFDFRFVKFLKIIHNMNQDDYIKYKIYSFYMDREDYRNALTWFSSMNQPELFWNSKEYVMIMEFLESHAGPFFERMRKKLFSFLKK